VRSLFPSVYEDLVFWAVFALYAGTIIFLFRTRRQQGGKRRQDVLDGIAAALVVGIVIGYARIGSLPAWVACPGAVLFVSGAALNAWSYSLLGKYLSDRVQVLPDHKLVAAGPYRYVRHPGYLGQIIAYIGLGLVLQSWLALLLILSVSGALLAYRIRFEEPLRGAELGATYAQYAKRTKHLLPFVW
jgi:protein-S-isoprenylcysteine O-methyltransferase